MTTSTTPSAASLFNAEDPLIDMAYITKHTRMTDKWFYKLIQDGSFPKPIKLGRSSRWYKSEVQSWMQQVIANSRGTEVNRAASLPSNG
ncbi:TPA: helix-turn-helix transcriptional regulator [Raoultella planticola]